MSMEPMIKKMIDKYERKSNKDEEVKEKVKDLNKTVNIDLGEEKYSFHVVGSHVEDFKSEPTESSDLTIISTPENLTALIEGDLRPMRAYVTKKIVIKGNIEDIMHLKSLL